MSRVLPGCLGFLLPWAAWDSEGSSQSLWSQYYSQRCPASPKFSGWPLEMLWGCCGRSPGSWYSSCVSVCQQADPLDHSRITYYGKNL